MVLVCKISILSAIATDFGTAIAFEFLAANGQTHRRIKCSHVLKHCSEVHFFHDPMGSGEAKGTFGGIKPI